MMCKHCNKGFSSQTSSYTAAYTLMVVSRAQDHKHNCVSHSAPQGVTINDPGFLSLRHTEFINS